jgi:hypothetical protein
MSASTAAFMVKVHDLRASAWDKFYVDNVLALDLTAIFGSGNEPTLAEMDRMLAKFPNSWFDGTVNPLLSVPELLIYANKNKANIAQEDWITPTLVNGWANTSARYYKDNFGIVRLKGSVANGTTTGGTILFNLPAGYRTLVHSRFPVADGKVSIEGNGDVKTLTTGLTPIYFDGITFKAEA